MTDQGSDFTPDELDRLEDALSALGDSAASGELEALPPKLRQRLGEYDAILALAREALPPEDVEPDLLAGILAEARQAAPAAARPIERGPGLWERLRRSFALPGLALAGTAALLLWVARPDGEAPRVEETAPTIEAAPSPAAPEARRAEAADAAPPVPEDMADDDAAGQGAPAKDAAPSQPAAAAEAAPLVDVPTASGKTKTSYGPSRAAKKSELADPLPGLDVPEEKRVDADKESVRDQLERGEAARNKGRCGEAEAEYAAVARSNGPARERARALAGLGLCREVEGDLARAERYFSEARALDPSVSTWLRGERDNLIKRAAKAKKSKATADGL